MTVKIRFRELPAIAIVALGCLLTFAARANDPIQFRVGTGAIAGTYHPIGALLVNIISQPPGSRACEDGGGCGVPNLLASTVSSHGSVANMRAIQDGRVHSGFSQADVASAMVYSQGAFSGLPRLDKIRAIASLYPETLHVVVRQGADIRSIKDLRGKRVSLDLLGSGTRFASNVILAEHGLGESDVIGIQTTAGQAAHLMRGGELDAFFLIAGMPARAITTLARDDIATVIPLGGSEAVKILADHPFFSPATIPDGTYDHIADIPTIAVPALWLTSTDVSEDLIHAICKSLWTEKARATLDEGHPQGKHIRLETALEGVAVPLHAGAERCYRELGVMN